MAWALLVVVGKHQVVEDLKGSNEGEKCHAFFVRISVRPQSGTINIDYYSKTDVPMGYNGQGTNEKMVYDYTFHFVSFGGAHYDNDGSIKSHKP